MNIIDKYKNYMLSGFVLLSTSPVWAAGAGDAAVTAITDSTAEAKTFGYAVIGALASIFVFKLIKKVI